MGTQREVPPPEARLQGFGESLGALEKGALGCVLKVGGGWSGLKRDGLEGGTAGTEEARRLTEQNQSQFRELQRPRVERHREGNHAASEQGRAAGRVARQGCNRVTS